ncbi:MAG TPA: MFS transporter [Bacillota bacterium]
MPRGILGVLFLGVLMGALDIAIVGPALPSIERDLAIDARRSAWLLTIFVLFNLVGTPLLARLSDLFGRRKVYALAVGLFGAGSGLAAASGSLAVLLAGRAVQGFAAGGMFPVATAVIGDVFPVERQGRALGMLGAVFGLAFLLGPVLGGLLLPFGWPWLFWINVPIAVLVALRALRVLPADGKARGARGRERAQDAAGGQDVGGAQDPREAEDSPSRRGATWAAGGAAPFDLAGLVWLTAGLTALALGTNAIDAERFGASLVSPQVAPVLAAAVVALGLFWRREAQAPDPLVNPDVLRNRALVIANLLAAVAGVVEAGIVFVPSLLVAAFAVAPATASFMLLPAVLAMAVGSPVTGRLLDRFGARPVVLAGSLILGLGLLAVRWTTGFLWALLAAGVVVGIGLSSLVGAPLRYIVLQEASQSHRASAQAVNTLFRSVGRMVGSALLGAMIASRAGSLGGYHLAFDAVAVVVLLGAVVSRGLPRPAPRRADPGAV